MPDIFYPIPKFRFKVKWDSLSRETEIGFTEVTGLDYQVDVIEYRDGIDPNLSKRKIAGHRKFSNVVLKRGVFKGVRDFYDWIDGGDKANEKSLVKRKDYRRTVTVTLMDEAAVEVVSWNLQNAFPTKVQFSDMKADGNEVSIETIELAHEGVTVSYH
ncbi:phage tail protein [Dyadobacter sandarakinus]|uniref:Phage tail protein n=1 Tax=Dyadobacter sandarakinus TaxID=2747268 RepID=A0ABX7I457_9BACT|nr:phage tail protein [Dyadobacter sandarakinus]QRR00614.1 phage tail protein [Dyadobacter sandarakinus]